MLCAAARMSLIGPKQTSCSRARMSAFGGKADITVTQRGLSERVHIFCRIRSAVRSAIMIVGRLVLALGMRGITEASMTRRLFTP